MRGTIVINLKTNQGYDEAKDYVLNVKDLIPRDLNVVICPSYINIPLFMGKFPFALGAQDVSPFNITGDITGNMLKSCMVRYCIVGHAERDSYYKEERELINLKVKECINNNIIPIICVGETLEERLRMKTQDVIYKQIKIALRNILVKDDLVFAYEPSWAIGSGKVLSLNDILEAVSLIKNILYKEYNANVKVLYGGSIDRRSAYDIFNISSLDGFLIGKSGSDLKELEEVFKEIAR